MKRKIIFTLFIMAIVLVSCDRFAHQDNQSDAAPQRIVCVSKQYNEIIFALGAQKNLVAVDVSSIYPPEIKSLPTVGYHRALTTEGILAMKPTLFMEDGNVGPEAVMQQLKQLKIPILKFPHDANTIDSTKMLIHDIGNYFQKQRQSDSLCSLLDTEMKMALDSAKQYNDHPKVMILQFGRVANAYLVVSGSGIAGKMVQWAGGDVPFKPHAGMVPLSAELIAKTNPDVILMTDYGYDRLGAVEKAKELPGVAVTNAGKNNRIYRVEEHNIIYLGPHTGENVIAIEKLIHAKRPS